MKSTLQDIGISDVEYAQRSIPCPAYLLPEHEPDEAWLTVVQEYWIAEQTVWGDSFKRICRLGASADIAVLPGMRGRAQLLLRGAAVRIADMVHGMRFPAAHEAAFRRQKTTFDHRAAKRASLMALMMWLIYSAYLVPAHLKQATLTGIFLSAGAGVIAIVAVAARGEDPRRGLSWVTLAGGAILALFMWLYPHLQPAIPVSKNTAICFLLLLFFMGSVADLGRRQILLLSAFLIILLLAEPLLFESPLGSLALGSDYVFRLLILALGGIVAFFIAYRRARSRRLIFSMECRNNAVLAYAQAVEPDIGLPSPDFAEGSQIITA